MERREERLGWSLALLIPGSIKQILKGLLEWYILSINYAFEGLFCGSAPKCFRLPFPSVKPHTTNSCCGRDLIFNQSGERFPGR
jgi:hypothetical protein